MESAVMKEMAGFLSSNLRLKTFPLAVKFLKDRKDFPAKTRQPSVAQRRSSRAARRARPAREDRPRRSRAAA